MGDGDFRVAVQARPPGHHQRPPLRLPAGLDKQVGKGRMRLVGLRRRQHRLETGDKFASQRRSAGVAQGDGSQLGIVLRADQHRDSGRDVLALRIELDPVGHEAGLVAPAGARCRTRRERDALGAAFSAQEEETAEGVAQQVIAPACDVLPAPAADAGTARAQRDGVAAVRQQVGRLPAGRDRIDLARLEHGGELVVAGLGRLPRIGALHDLARRAFMEQHFMRFHHCVGAEPAPRRVIAQHIAQGGERHPLVVGHEGFDHAVRLSRGLAGYGEVQGLEHAELAASA